MNTILVTSDFSTNANLAVRYAIRLSLLMKCKLVVFHCTFQSPYTLATAKNEKEMDLLISLDEKNKTELLKKRVKAIYKNLRIINIPTTTKVLAQFNPIFIEKTIEIAKKYKAGLIIMGTHGASGFKKFFFGSNTSVMISKSEIPVLAIPEKLRFKKINTILYASDLQNIETELPKVIEFAIPLNSMINILYVDYGIDYKGKRFTQAEKIIQSMRYKKITLLKLKANEKPLIIQVKDYLNSKNEEWLVMFTKKRSFWEKIISDSKTVELSMNLTVPLLSIKK